MEEAGEATRFDRIGWRQSPLPGTMPYSERRLLPELPGLGHGWSVGLCQESIWYSGGYPILHFMSAIPAKTNLG